jgi:glycosyltransferase involved in cell wall biosynthesis
VTCGKWHSTRMRIAFYAPLKPPDHPVASGDRSMARALIAAIERAGHEISLASHFRSFDSGDTRRQARLREEGRKLAHRYLRRIERGGEAPDLWFTYHLYHKAPDWLGPVVTARLHIPYVIVEASYAPKQEGGKWALGHRAVGEAVQNADLILQPNPVDAECVLPLLTEPKRMKALRPFTDTAPFRALDRVASRAAVSALLGLDESVPWLVTVAMMREDQKLLSYRILADALAQIGEKRWQLVIAGAGAAQREIRELFMAFGERVRWAGVVTPEVLRQLYRAADLYVWPAVKEAFGMAFIEAQAAGLPVVAGRSGGIPNIVIDGETGLLTREGDARAFTEAVGSLLRDPVRRAEMARAAARFAEQHLDIGAASSFLDAELQRLVGPR